MPGVENKPVGEAIKDTQTGKLPIGTAQQILEKAPSDIVEEILEIPEWGYSVRVRSFTAAMAARIKSNGFQPQADGSTIVNWAAMEQTQLKQGIVEPKFSEDEIKKLYNKSGQGVQRIIEWLDEHSKMDKDEMKQKEREFQGSEESS